IRSVKTLRNGGILVEMETKSLATWISSPEGKGTLESHLDTVVSFCQHLYPIVLEYLPIQMQIEKENFLRNVE
ncbi:hypothetical protein BDR05DRAFT_878545, partial [Suillus weaverae]